MPRETRVPRGDVLIRRVRSANGGSIYRGPDLRFEDRSRAMDRGDVCVRKIERAVSKPGSKVAKHTARGYCVTVICYL